MTTMLKSKLAEIAAQAIGEDVAVREMKTFELIGREGVTFAPSIEVFTEDLGAEVSVIAYKAEDARAYLKDSEFLTVLKMLLVDHLGSSFTLVERESGAQSESMICFVIEEGAQITCEES